MSELMRLIIAGLVGIVSASVGVLIGYYIFIVKLGMEYFEGRAYLYIMIFTLIFAFGIVSVIYL